MPTELLFRPDDLESLMTSEPATRVIDVRTPGEFAGRHIPGSYNVPLADLPEHRTELAATDGAPVVLVCESGRRAGLAEEQLASHGLTRVHVLDGGVQAWEAQGRPLQRLDPSTTPWALERQVRLVAGGIVAASVAASVAWPPARYLAGAVGAGLVVAALTDTCTMGLLLSRLPYNRSGSAGCDLPTIVSTLTDAEEERA